MRENLAICDSVTRTDIFLPSLLNKHFTTKLHNHYYTATSPVFSVLKYSSLPIPLIITHKFKKVFASICTTRLSNLVTMRCKPLPLKPVSPAIITPFNSTSLSNKSFLQFCHPLKIRHFQTRQLLPVTPQNFVHQVNTI